MYFKGCTREIFRLLNQSHVPFKFQRFFHHEAGPPLPHSFYEDFPGLNKGLRFSENALSPSMPSG